jgi:fibronectin-binding autotransporter adhesin
MSPLYRLARSFRIVESAFNPKFKFRKTSFAWTPAIVGLLLLSASVLPVSGQTQFFWRGDGGLTGNWNASNTWWNGAESAAGFGQLNFDNSAYPNGTNDSPFDTYRIYISSASGVARTTNGTATVTFYDFNGSVPLIRNDSSFLNTFNQNFNVGNTNAPSGRAVELVAAAGDLTFGGTWSTANVTDVTRELNIKAGSGRTITLNGQVTQVNASNALQLRISDNGTAILNGSNNYTGTTFFERGVLLLGNNSALGTGTLQFQFGIGDFRTLASSNSTARTIANNINVFNNLTLGQSTGGTGSLTLGGTFFLGDEVDQVRIVNLVGDHTVSGNITGGRGLVKQGTGTMTISGSANTQNGTLFIDNGIVNVNTSSLSNPFIDIGAGSSGESPNNATLRINSATTFASNLTIKNFDGTGGLRTLDFANTSGIATLSGSVTLEKAVTMQVANSGATGVLSGNISGSGGPLITVQGSGTLSPTSTNSTTSARWQVETGATLAINHTRNLGANPDGHYDNKILLAGGTLRATGSFTTNANVGLNATASSSVAVDAGSTLNFQGGVRGSAGLAKTGEGTLNLNHAASSYTYSGTWTAQAGTLLVNTNHGGAVTVNSATLGGTGTIGGLVTLNSGGTLTPGNSVGALATMTLSNGLSLNDSSTVRMDISNTSGSSDVISLSGTLANNGVLELNILTAMPGGNFSNTYTIFSGGAKTGSWDSVNLAGAYTGALTNNGNTWTRNTGDGTLWTYDQSVGTLTVIPEPSTYALMGIGAAFILWRLRRRRQD